MIRKKTIYILIFIILIIQSLILSSQINNEITIRKLGIETKGTVKKIEMEPADGKNNFFITSSYVSEKKTLYIKDVCFYYDCPYKVGDSIKIKYNREDPTTAFYSCSIEYSLINIVVNTTLMLTLIIFMLFLKKTKHAFLNIIE